MGHYYQKDGTPMYEVENKSKGGLRPTTIADARKLDLVPSVTEIIKIVYSDGLQRWIRGQIVEAAWKLRSEQFADDQFEIFSGKVFEMADTISTAARDKGGEIHNAIENFLKITTCIGEYAEWQRTFAKWWMEQGWFGKNGVTLKTEQYIPATMGYGGRYDILVATPDTAIILDVKTQNTKGKPFNFYRSWGWQLAAYGRALNTKRIISIAIDSQDSSRIESKEWEDYDQLLKEFDACCLVWQAENKFYIGEMK